MLQQKLAILAERMPSIVQWAYIMFMGLLANTFDYAADIYRLSVTVISMGVGTVVSHYLKKFLNRKKDKDD